MRRRSINAFHDDVNMNINENLQTRRRKRHLLQRKNSSAFRNGARMVFLVLSFLQLAIWIHLHPSHLQAHAFGRTYAPTIANTNPHAYQRTGNPDSFFDTFREDNLTQRQRQNKHKSSTTELYFSPTRNPIDSDPLQYYNHRNYFYRGQISSLLVLMGKKGGSKGDRQNKKPKINASSNASSSSSSSSPSSPSPPSSPAPQRVSNQINVSIRRQIRYGKINKQLREAAASGSAFRQTKKGNFVSISGPGAAGPIKRTAYRKQLDEETIQQKALERQRKGQDPDWSVILNQTKADPLVLVDGYNVIYKWPRLKKHMTRGDTDRARQLLLEDLEGLASLQRWRIECVFDGAGRAAIPGPLGSGPGNSNSNTNLGTNPTLAPFGKTGSVRTVYTGRNIEADTYIEGRCAAAKNVTMGLTTSSLIVATDDSQIKLAANSAGALCMSSDRFVLELKAVKKGIQYRVEKAMSEVNNAPMRHESQWGAPKTAASEQFFQGSASIGSSTENIKKKPKREVVQENEDGSKLVMARYGANEILIKDNRNKKPKMKSPLNGTPKKKKKKKKKK